MLTCSLIIAANDRPYFLVSALRSALEQSRKIDKIWIYATNPLDFYFLPEPPVMYNIGINIGIDNLTGKLNDGFGKSTTDVVFMLCDDDVLTPDYVKTHMELLENHPYDIAYCDMEIFNESSSYISPSGDWMDVNKYNPLPISALMRKYVWEDVGGYAGGIDYLDWDFWWKAFDKGYRAVHINKPLLRYRAHGEQWSRNCDVEYATKVVKEMHKK